MTPERRNPGEPIILVLYGPWHLFFALFLEMVISGYHWEPTVVNKVLPSPCKKKERARGPFKRSWASYDILFCSLARTTVFAKTMSCHGPQATANSQTHACSHFTTACWHGVLHTKRSDFGGQRSFAFATFRLVLFTTFFTAPMGRCKIQRGAFTLPFHIGKHHKTSPPHRK